MNQSSPNEEQIFRIARVIPSSIERLDYLKQVCGDNSQLFERMVALLKTTDEENSFLESPPEALAATRGVPPVIIEKPGKEIGPYKLLQQIGEGGMGSVYMAQQEKPVKRRVALKVIKAGMDSKQVIARFESERQALALMDHPNIARLLDVGTTDTGRPYFVMELVKGIPITEYCDQKRLNVAERLNLFSLVCNAVQHAHQKGIIHRDLKPNNILITEYDEKVAPKIIDFGLAKALGQNLTDKTMFTQFGQVMGTLAYMSPEQSKVNALDVDTRADIYSLGVLLYELLTGSTPFEEKTLQGAAFDQALRIIREETPQKPSTRLSSDGTDPLTAPNRNTEPSKLGKLVRGDLDWIVMKALEKERSRRYETANAFADDICRYLKDDVIVARPPTASYRFGKFVKKNRGLVVASTLIAASLVAGIIGTSIGLYQQAENSRQQIEFANQKAATDQEQIRRRTEFANEQSRLKEIADDRADRAEKAERESAWREYAANIKLAQTEWDYGNVNLAWNALNTGRSELRGWEYDFLCTKFTRFQLDLRGHTGGVFSVAFSPDGTQIVSGSSDNTIKVWNAASGEESLTLKGHTASVSSVAFSPDGTQIASGSWDKTIKVWSAASGEESLTLKGHNGRTGRVFCVAFSPDGKRIVSGSHDNTIRVWNATSGEEILTLNEIPAVIRVFSSPRVLSDGVISVAFSPDGKRIVSGGSDRTIKVWNANSGEKNLTLKGHTGGVFSVAFSPDGTQIVSGSRDNTIKVWNATSGEETLNLKGHTDSVNSVAFTPDGTQIVSGSEDDTIKVWNAANGEESLTLQGHTGSVSCVAFSPDATRIVSGSYDLTIKMWNVSRDEATLTLKGHTRIHTGSPGRSGRGIRSRPRVYSGGVYSVAFSPDGTQIVSGGRDNTIRVWNATSGEETLTLNRHILGVWSVAFSPDGTQVVSGSGDNTIKVWNATSGEETLTLKGHTGGVNSVAFSPDGTQIVSGSRDNTIKVWNATSGEEILTLHGHTEIVWGVTFSPDGKQIVSGSGDNTIKVWNATSGEEIHTLKGHTEIVWGVTFSPDGKQIVSGSGDNTIKLWNATSGEEIHTLKGHTETVSGVTFSPDGKRIVSGSHDNTIRVWNVATGVETLTLKGLADSVFCVAFSPDGKRIVSGSHDNTIRVWNATSGDAKSLINQNNKVNDGMPDRAEQDEKMKLPLSSRPKKDISKRPKSFRSADENSQARYERYVDSLMNRYDEDKDGKLSKKEQQKMRRPPTRADSNNDGMVSRNELIDSLSGK